MPAPLNDIKLKAMRIQLKRTTGTIHELEQLYAQFLGGSLADVTIQAWKDAFDELLQPAGPQPQRWYRYLESIGFDRTTINQREHNYWSSAAGIPPINVRITGSGDTRVTGDGCVRITAPEPIPEVFLFGRVTGTNDGRLTADGDRRVYV